MRPMFAPSVGVAPGTTTVSLAGSTLRMWNPYATSIVDMRGFGAIDTRARMRWDIIGVVGGTALIVAMSTALIASTLGRR